MNYIVDDVFSVGQVHLINGASGSGKSSWLFQFLRDFSDGKPIFGKASHPCPWVYVAYDRGLDEIHDAMDRFGCPHDDNNVISLDDVENVTIAHHLHPYVKEHHKLVIIEAIGALFSTGKDMNDYVSVRKFIATIKHWIRPRGITLIATTHDAKTKTGNEIKNIREKVVGSVSWGANTSTSISLDTVTESQRLVSVHTRKTKLLEQAYEIQDNGLWTPVELEALSQNEQGHFQPKEDTQAFEQNILAYPVGEILTTAAIYPIAEDLFKISQKTAQRILKKLVDTGHLEAMGYNRTARHSEYRRKNPLTN